MTGFEVLDSAVKIGLGALITAAASIITLNWTHRHELEKDYRQKNQLIVASKKQLYVNFLTTSHMLIQKYRETQCRADGEDYFEYLRLYHEIAIVAEDPLRISANHLLIAVNEFITFNKTNDGEDFRDLFRKMRARVDEIIAQFQYLAKQEVNISPKGS